MNPNARSRRDRWPSPDAGHGWLIFALPPGEIGVHPAESPAEHAGMQHQFTLTCDDIAATVRDLRAKGVIIDGEPQDQGWGITVMMTLPGGVEVMLYEPRHRGRVLTGENSLRAGTIPPS